jgi:putative transposase
LALLTLNYREVKELLAERVLDILETVRRFALKFVPLIACKLRQRRPPPSKQWNLDWMVVRIARPANVSVARHRR